MPNDLDPGDWLLLYTLAPATLYWLVYGLGSPWYRSPLGVVMFLFATSIVAILGLVAFAVLFGQAPPPVRIPVYAGLALAMTAKLVILIVERRGADPARFTPHRKDNTMSSDLTEGGRHIAIGTETVPEIWYKTQRVVRTIVEALIVLVPIVNGVALAIVGYLNEQTDVTVPAWVFLALNGAIAVTALLMGLAARVAAVPGVNAWLAKIGLGSVPKKAIERGEV